MVKKQGNLDIVIGTNKGTKESIILDGKDRRRHTLITASNGVGRAEAVVLPVIKQDLSLVGDYTEKRKIAETEILTGDYLNGITIMESTNEICRESLKLANEFGIPDEAITYINPLDPNTSSINPMRGDVDKVVRVFTEVVEDFIGLSDNFYQIQAQRDHLKHYIYLLKFHDTDKDVTLDMLLDMYNNPQLVRAMHVSLKSIIPTEIEEIKDRDERNYWKIAQGIDYWFDTNLLPKLTKSGPITIPEYDEFGYEVYMDVLAEETKGLKSVLNDIGANQKLRRVLFGTSDFDFDVHLNGGILLINTAKHELGVLSNVLGKIVLMNLQNATFNRDRDSSTHHHIIVEELPEYIYQSFLEFTVFASKVKVFLTVSQQTDSEVIKRFGKDYQYMLSANIRNKITYDSLPDAWYTEI